MGTGTGTEASPEAKSRAGTTVVIVANKKQKKSLRRERETCVLLLARNLNTKTRENNITNGAFTLTTQEVHERCFDRIEDCPFTVL